MRTLLLLLLLAAPSAADTRPGSVTALLPSAKIERAGSTTAAAPGAEVQANDLLTVTVRRGKPPGQPERATQDQMETWKSITEPDQSPAKDPYKTY